MNLIHRLFSSQATLAPTSDEVVHYHIAYTPKTQELIFWRYSPESTREIHNVIQGLPSTQNIPASITNVLPPNRQSNLKAIEDLAIYSFGHYFFTSFVFLSSIWIGSYSIVVIALINQYNLSHSPDCYENPKDYQLPCDHYSYSPQLIQVVGTAVWGVIAFGGFLLTHKIRKQTNMVLADPHHTFSKGILKIIQATWNEAHSAFSEALLQFFKKEVQTSSAILPFSASLNRIATEGITPQTGLQGLNQVLHGHSDTSRGRSSNAANNQPTADSTVIEMTI